MKRKKIGVYLINFNYGNFLPWSMRSLDAQTRKPDALVFTDDCSTDNSIQIFTEECKRTGQNDGRWLCVLHKENQGAVKTMNEAVDMLIDKGCDYVCGLSADDVFHKDYLKETERALSSASKNIGYVYTWVRRFGDENSIDKHEEFNSDNLMKHNFVHGSSLIKAEAWKAVGGLADVKVCEDWDMYKRMARLGIIGKLIPKPLLLWRKHSLGCRTQGTRGK